MLKDLPMCSFLWQARKVVLKYLEPYGVSHEFAEQFFNCTFLHAIDHRQNSKILAGVPVTLNMANPSSRIQWFYGRLFMEFFPTPTLNIVRCNRIRYAKAEIYRLIYKDLAEIDLELANEITCSIMY